MYMMLQTMYEFGYDIGGMERSRYFGMSKDLYHFDHFLGKIPQQPESPQSRSLIVEVHLQAVVWLPTSAALCLSYVK